MILTFGFVVAALSISEPMVFSSREFGSLFLGRGTFMGCTQPCLNITVKCACNTHNLLEHERVTFIWLLEHTFSTTSVPKFDLYEMKLSQKNPATSSGNNVCHFYISIRFS
jgi:hypothetical protein